MFSSIVEGMLHTSTVHDLCLINWLRFICEFHAALYSLAVFACIDCLFLEHYCVIQFTLILISLNNLN